MALMFFLSGLFVAQSFKRKGAWPYACDRTVARRSTLLETLSSNAYGLYLVHYTFVVWLQYALLTAALFAVIKAAVVFGGTLV